MLRLGREARVEDDRYDLCFTTPAPPVDPDLTFEVAERVRRRRQRRSSRSTDDRRRRRRPRSSRDAAGGGRDLPPARLRQPRARARASPRALPARRCPDAFVVGVDRGLARGARVRARDDDGHVRLRRAGDGRRTSRASKRGCGELGHALPGRGHGVERRRAVGRGSPPAGRSRTVESGGAAGVIAAGVVGAAVGADDVISFDMGGTTAKAGIVRDGRPGRSPTTSRSAARAASAAPAPAPASRSRSRSSTSPRSARAAAASPGSTPAARCASAPGRPAPIPGPACYGRGGTEPTVTDANLVLGYLDPGGLAGGVTLLDRRSPSDAVERVGAHAARRSTSPRPPAPSTRS